MTLKNQKVVIVGGSAGIGLALAKAAALQGAEIVVASRSQEKIERATSEISGAVEGYTVDVVNEQSIKSLFEKVGEFDHLVTTPGDPLTFAEFLQADTLHVKETFDVKFWGQYLCAKHGAARISRNGSITFMSGSGGASRGTSTLACINGATEALCKSLAVELAPVRVNVVRPGMIDTDAWSNFPEPERQEMYRTVGEGLLVKRTGTVEEVADTYLYLLMSRFTTGTAITIDGGAM